jgi:heme/copper-type cytochrome/quinol oxidase subunit 2
MNNNSNGMNKYIIIGIAVLALVAGGIGYSAIKDTDNCTAGMGKDVSFTVVSKKLEWRFEPETINVEKCDRVKMKVTNEDDFDHGVAIDAFGISQRLPALGEIDIEFVASKAGEFPFYCSVSCSGSDNSSFGLANGKVASGPYAGTVRGHFDHIGKFIVGLVKAATGN